MSRVWYYRSEDAVRGPLDSAGLKRLAASGRITPDTLVRRGTDGAWLAARDLPALARLMAKHDVPRPQGQPAGVSSAAGRDAGNAGMPLAWPVAGMLTDSFSDADGGWARESAASSGGESARCGSSSSSQAADITTATSPQVRRRPAGSRGRTPDP